LSGCVCLSGKWTGCLAETATWRSTRTKWQQVKGSLLDARVKARCLGVHAMVGGTIEHDKHLVGSGFVEHHGRRRSGRQHAQAAGGSGTVSAAMWRSTGRRVGPVGAVSSSRGAGPRFARCSAGRRTRACARWEQVAGRIWGKRHGFRQ
jgi:hypothetical protein